VNHPYEPWDWYNISRNPSITWDIVRENPDKPWIWSFLSAHPNITWDIVENNPDHPWDWWHLIGCIIIPVSFLKHCKNMQYVSGRNDVYLARKIIKIFAEYVIQQLIKKNQKRKQKIFTPASPKTYKAIKCKIKYIQGFTRWPTA